MVSCRSWPMWSWCLFLLLGSGAVFLFFLGLVFLCAADTFPLPAETKRTACGASLAASFLNLACFCLLMFLLSKPKGWLRERLSSHALGRSLFRFGDDFSARFLPRRRTSCDRSRRGDEEERGRRTQEDERDCETGRHSAFQREASQHSFSRLNRKKDFLREERDAAADDRRPAVDALPQEMKGGDTRWEETCKRSRSDVRRWGCNGETAEDRRACNGEDTRGEEPFVGKNHEERKLSLASFLEREDLEALDLLAGEVASPTSTTASSETQETSAGKFGAESFRISLFEDSVRV
ncbi:putative transmembrane protein [Toxoplasma gondii GAB2-2007-GAL-DOM2]|uniref:Putative transmembrane protein n=2 Tax=Toxoplasma gondii TaxID=5811 RepID=A0A086KSA9_TOXGO|nr:putative transmembrane protein [Toxoplasma gondii GAB2-2007-GAL-DOM2]KFG47277.1 putative transmembrane protein [Toxoplasma gondii FOU]